MGLVSTLQAALDLSRTEADSSVVRSVTAQKASTALAMACSEVFDHPDRLTDNEDVAPALRSVMCLALVHLAKQAIADRPLSTLITSKLIPRANKAEAELTDDQVDLSVGCICLAPGIIY